MSKTRPLFVVTLLAVTFLLAGCGNKLRHGQFLNIPPEVHFDAASAPVRSGDEVLNHVSWSGHDPDGRIVEYLVAVNPRSLDRVDGHWHATPEHERALRTRRALLPRSGARIDLEAQRSFDVIAVRARDNGGSLSDPIARAFFEGNVAPSVAITSPVPSALIIHDVPSAFRIQWQGVDPDGQTRRPVKYRFKLFREGSLEYTLAVTDPDSLRRLYAPRFAGWIPVPVDSDGVTLRSLEVDVRYLFVITAFDRAGDYDPIFSLNKNMLRFRVGFEAVAEAREPEVRRDRTRGRP